MAVDSHPDQLPSWTGPEACPFCWTPLPDGRPAFMDHVGATPACEAAFDAWRARVADDMAGDWAG